MRGDFYYVVAVISLLFYSFLNLRLKRVEYSQKENIPIRMAKPVLKNGFALTEVLVKVVIIVFFEMKA